MTYLTNSRYLCLTTSISKLDIKTVVTAWNSLHLEHKKCNTNRDFNLGKEISAPRYIPGQAWDLPCKEIVISYLKRFLSTNKYNFLGTRTQFVKEIIS